MRGRIKPVGVYAAWGAFFGVISNLIQRGLIENDWRLGVMLGAALGGAFLGAAIWWWRSKFTR